MLENGPWIGDFPRPPLIGDFSVAMVHYRGVHTTSLWSKYVYRVYVRFPGLKQWFLGVFDIDGDITYLPIVYHADCIPISYGSNKKKMQPSFASR